MGTKTKSTDAKKALAHKAKLTLLGIALILSLADITGASPVIWTDKVNSLCCVLAKIIEELESYPDSESESEG